MIDKKTEQAAGVVVKKSAVPVTAACCRKQKLLRMKGALMSSGVSDHAALLR